MVAMPTTLVCWRYSRALPHKASKNQKKSYFMRVADGMPMRDAACGGTFMMPGRERRFAPEGIGAGGREENDV